VLSHLAYEFPVKVRDSGAIDLAVAALQELCDSTGVSQSFHREGITHEEEQLLEGACRMLSTVPVPDASCEAVVHILFKVLQTNPSRKLQTLSLEGSGVWLYDSFKLRAGEALDKLLRPHRAEEPQDEHVAARIQRAREAILSELNNVRRALMGAPDSGECLLWLVIHSALRRMISDVSLDTMLHELAAPAREDDLVRSLSRQHSLRDRNELHALDVQISLLALHQDVQGDSVKQLEEVAHQLRLSHACTRGDFSQNFSHGPFLTRWCALARTLDRYVQAEEATRCATASSIVRWLIQSDLPTTFIEWLTGPYAYKAYPCNSLSLLVEHDDDAFQFIATVMKKQHASKTKLKEHLVELSKS